MTQGEGEKRGARSEVVMTEISPTIFFRKS